MDRDQENNGEAFFSSKQVALTYALFNLDFVHRFKIKDDINVLNIVDVDSSLKLISALNKVSGLWDMEAGLEAEKRGENPFVLGSIDNIRWFISVTKRSNISKNYKIAIINRTNPFKQMIIEGKAPTVNNPGKYYELLFRFAFGFEEESIWWHPFNILKSYLGYSNEDSLRYSVRCLDHELMYAICKVLLKNGIAGYGAPRLLSYDGYLAPEIMLCNPHEVLLSNVHSKPNNENKSDSNSDCCVIQ